MRLAKTTIIFPHRTSLLQRTSILGLFTFKNKSRGYFSRLDLKARLGGTVGFKPGMFLFRV